MSTVKKTAPKKAAPAHPKYSEMIAAAITALANRKGSSKIAIANYISANNKVGDRHNSQLNLALKRGLLKKSLVKAKGEGLSGSFKLAVAEKKVAAKKPAAKKVAKKVAKPTKKAATPKKAAKKVAKKPTKKAATPKKSPKKVAKKVTKKVTPKKTTPKKAAPKKAKK